MKRFIFLLASTFVLLFSLHGISYAMPSFSRQTGYACNTCHTIPPRLNKDGMMFKMRGYTEGKAISSFDMGDGKEILQYNPMSIRLLNLLYSKEKGENDETIFPEEFMIGITGKVTDNVGAIIQPVFEGEEEEWSMEMARIAWVRDFENTLVGITGGWTSPVGTDPFNSLDPVRRITREQATPHHEGISESGLLDMFGGNNRGASLYAFINNMFYVNGGVYRGLSRNTEGHKINEGPADPLDFYGRIAFLPRTDFADINLGLFTYAGKEEYEEGEAINRETGNDFADSKSSTFGADIGLLKSFGDDIIIELIGQYISGKDKPKDEITGDTSNIDHKGYDIWGTLYYKNKIGITLGYGGEKFNDANPFQFSDGSTGEPEEPDRRRDATIGISYMFRPNIRLAAEYTDTNWKNSPDSNLTSLILDVSF